MQSLLLAAVLLIVGFQVMLMGLRGRRDLGEPQAARRSALPRARPGAGRGAHSGCAGRLGHVVEASAMSQWMGWGLRWWARLLAISFVCFALLEITSRVFFRYYSPITGHNTTATWRITWTNRAHNGTAPELPCLSKCSIRCWDGRTDHPSETPVLCLMQTESRLIRMVRAVQQTIRTAGPTRSGSSLSATRLRLDRR